ncbi:hypothetical protein AMTRI_Chr02g258430 [Amborella trichopoda]
MYSPLPTALRSSSTLLSNSTCSHPLSPCTITELFPSLLPHHNPTVVRFCPSLNLNHCYLSPKPIALRLSFPSSAIPISHCCCPLFLPLSLTLSSQSLFSITRTLRYQTQKQKPVSPNFFTTLHLLWGHHCALSRSLSKTKRRKNSIGLRPSSQQLQPATFQLHYLNHSQIRPHLSPLHRVIFSTSCSPSQKGETGQGRRFQTGHRPGGFLT